jgi:penicillin-binding protein 1A
MIDSLLQEVARSGTAAKAQATLKRPTCSARPARPTIRWMPGSPASSPAWPPWSGSATTPAQAGLTGNRRRPGPAGLDPVHEQAIKNVPVSEYEPPAGVVNANGEWYYEEYANGHGVSATGEEHLPHPPTEDEKKGILDLFR